MLTGKNERYFRLVGAARTAVEERVLAVDREDAEPKDLGRVGHRPAGALTPHTVKRGTAHPDNGRTTSGLDPGQARRGRNDYLLQ